MAGAGSYNKHDVMISYNSGSKETVFKIRDYLKQNGVTFWIDVEHMSGSTLEAMSAAVEKCTVFLMCYSAKYSQSENCQSEAEYARKRKKIIIPCKMEKGFDPSGWLGILIGSKVFYDFSGKYPFENKIQELLRVVKSHLKTVTDVSLPRKGETSRRMEDDPTENNKGAEVDFNAVMNTSLNHPCGTVSSLMLPNKAVEDFKAKWNTSLNSPLSLSSLTEGRNAFWKIPGFSYTSSLMEEYFSEDELEKMKSCNKMKKNL